jgi:hypothetical protein
MARCRQEPRITTDGDFLRWRSRHSMKWFKLIRKVVMTEVKSPDLASTKSAF